MTESEFIAELEDAVAQSPGDDDLRRELVEHLLLARDFDAALGQLEILADRHPDALWPLRLATSTAMAAENPLSAARYRARLSEMERHPSHLAFDQSLDTDHSVIVPHPKHPSRSTSVVRRLQLVIGGTGQAIEPQSPLTRLDDAAGIRTVRRNLREILEEVRNASVGNPGKWFGGLLLYGPPNCGKSFAAEIIAGELEAPLWTFDLAHHWKPGGLQHSVRASLEKASAQSISVFSFTNLDVPHTDHVILPIVDMLDRARLSSRVVILGSATAPWAVSPEIVGEQRLSRVLLVLPPDAPARSAYLTECFRGRATISTGDVDWLAHHTDGYSFRDLRAIVDRVVTLALDECSADASIVSVTHEMVRKARTSVAMSSAEWLTTAAQHAMMNERSGLYDDLIAYLQARRIG